MHGQKLVPVALVLLLMGAWFAAPSRAAELAGPSTEAAPGSCSAEAAIFSLPSSLVSPEVMPATDPVTICGCGDAVCIGKVANSHCGSIARFCQVIGLCSAVTQGKRCGCLPPP